MKGGDGNFSIVCCVGGYWSNVGADGFTRPVGVYSNKKKAQEKVDEAPSRYWITESWNNEIEVERN